jgi:two-component sensor histidine kinase
MQSARMPANEQERLQALARYRILDSEPEPDFDGLTALVAHILNVPIALISLVDTDRQWFKSHHGIEVSETDRASSFCAHVVANDHGMVVCDARADSRFADNPLVSGDSRVRFYAGMPLRTEDGYVLGTLCAIDHVPRQLTAEQHSMLDILARQVMGQLELRRRNLVLTEHDRVQWALQERLRESLAEKEVLLREVHHRVKNNLQLISSLINLQLAVVPTGAARTALQECQGRIHAVAVVHDAIYSARDYARVPIAEYARGLASSVFHALGAVPRDVSLELEIGDLQLPVDRAIPCGLILNELLTNALKHAFPNGRPGVVRVVVDELADERLRMRVIDNGVGLPAGFVPEHCSSVGMQVLSALVEQLDATLEVSTQNGTCFTLTLAPE